MKQKLNRPPDKIEALIYNQYCGGDSIAELAKKFSLSKNNIRNVITKCRCAGAGLTVKSGQQELAL